MSLPTALAALRDEAMRTSCESWALQHRWTLSRGRDRSGPCPKCGGSDRFSINTLKNVFNCRQCGLRGEGVIALVMQTQGVEFVPACEIITGRKAADPVDEVRAEQNRRELAAKAERARAEGERYRRKARQDGHDIWVSGWAPAEAGPVAEYLRRRALDFAGHAAIAGIGQLRIREYDALPWTEEHTDERGYRAWRTLHHGPAMLLPIILPARLVREGDPLGQFGAVHQTWLDLEQPKGRLVLPDTAGGKKRPTKKMRGMKQGGAIPLYTPREPRRIVMGEGAETTLTPFCHAFEAATAYWAGGDSGNMAGKPLYVEGKAVHEQPDMEDLECFLVPDWCEELVYLGEADDPGKHQREKCLRGLRRNQRVREVRRAENPALKPLAIIFVPPAGGGNDLNDVAMDELGATP